jgi:hypothetical protein
MTLSQIRTAMSLYPMASKQQQIRQAISYVKAKESLGDKHLLAVKVQRLPQPRFA